MAQGQASFQFALRASYRRGRLSLAFSLLLCCSFTSSVNDSILGMVIALVDRQRIAGGGDISLTQDLVARSSHEHFGQGVGPSGRKALLVASELRPSSPPSVLHIDRSLSVIKRLH